MEHLFYDARSFNQNISSWDASSVRTMIGMFFNGGAAAFDQPISAWQTSLLVVNDMMSQMFLWRNIFQPIPIIVMGCYECRPINAGYVLRSNCV